MDRTQAAFEHYRSALDECVELARERAFKNIDDEVSSAEALQLDVKYMRAALNAQRKRDEWVKLRDAQWSGDAEH